MFTTENTQQIEADELEQLNAAVRVLMQNGMSEESAERRVSENWSRVAYGCGTVSELTRGPAAGGGW